MVENIENAQIELLKNSGLLSEFVRKSGGNWSQTELENLLIRIREQNIIIHPEEVSAMLEAERIALSQKAAVSNDGEQAANFDDLGLRKKREFLEKELKRRIR
jgi:hypothetical protein